MAYDRTRDKDLRTWTKHALFDVYHVGQAGSFLDASSIMHDSSRAGEQKVMEDCVFKQYRKRLRRGEVMIGNMHLVKVNRETSDLNFVIGPSPSYFNGGWWHLHGDWNHVIESWTPYWLDVNQDIMNMKEIAQVKALAKLNSAPIQVGELANEFRETILMLKRPFANSRKLLADMRKWRGRHMGKSVSSMYEATKNAWLEYRYGWRPIVMDADMILQEAAKIGVTRQSKRLVARARETYNRSESRDFVCNMVPGYNIWAIGSSIATRDVTVDAGVLYDVELVIGCAEALRVFGMRPSDVPSTVWNCIPYSFVADWFTNIGDWLQAISPAPGITTRGGWVTTITKKNQQFPAGSMKCVWPYLPAPVYGGYSESILHEEDVLRENWPPFVPALPTLLKRKLGQLNCIDALALETTNISKEIRHWESAFDRRTK